MNYFELFDLPLTPVVDKTLLSKKYFDLQKKTHPDFFSQSTGNEQEEALELSADINNAYTIFQNRDKTLEYFLILSGTVLPGEKYVLPPGFLMEMMEINETLSEGEDVLINNHVEEYIAKLENEIDPVIKGIKDGHNNDDLQNLKAYYYKKKYLNRILERLSD